MHPQPSAPRPASRCRAYSPPSGCRRRWRPPEPDRPPGCWSAAHCRAPLVLSDTAPVSRLALARLIVALAAEAVNDEVPPTLSTPDCVRLPSVLTTLRLPPAFT